MAVGVFGPGIAIVTRTDVSPSPALNIGFINSLSLDLTGTTKQLYGQNQYPLLVARSTIKTSGKMVAAETSGLAQNAIFFGGSFVAGGFKWNISEPHTVAATTQAVTNAGTFDQDLGVTYASSGLPLQRVAPGSEAAGKYSVNVGTGVYTFNVADEVALLFSYTSTIATPGQNLTVANSLIGTTPTFQLDYYTSFNQPTAKPLVVRVFACISSKIALSFKLEDFMMPEYDFEFFANAAGNVMEIVYPEIS